MYTCTCTHTHVMQTARVHSVVICVALEEMEAGMSMTTRLEELRKEGGDKWLSILNAEKSKVHVVVI